MSLSGVKKLDRELEFFDTLSSSGNDCALETITGPPFLLYPPWVGSSHGTTISGGSSSLSPPETHHEQVAWTQVVPTQVEPGQSELKLQYWLTLEPEAHQLPQFDTEAQL
jgi:hypothetical protein